MQSVMLCCGITQGLCQVLCPIASIPEEVPLQHAQDVHHFQLIHEQPAEINAILVTLLIMVVVLGFVLADATPKCCHHMIRVHDAVHALSLQLCGKSCEHNCSMGQPLSSPA